MLIQERIKSFSEMLETDANRFTTQERINIRKTLQRLEALQELWTAWQSVPMDAVTKKTKANFEPDAILAKLDHEPQIFLEGASEARVLHWMESEFNVDVCGDFGHDPDWTTYEKCDDCTWHGRNDAPCQHCYRQTYDYNYTDMFEPIEPKQPAETAGDTEPDTAASTEPNVAKDAAADDVTSEPEVSDATTAPEPAAAPEPEAPTAEPEATPETSTEPNTVKLNDLMDKDDEQEITVTLAQKTPVTVKLSENDVINWVIRCNNKRTLNRILNFIQFALDEEN